MAICRKTQKKTYVKWWNKKRLIWKSWLLHWYGGEPLLAISPIERLTKKFKKICKRFNIEYSASIITNGYLLTEDVCNKLLDLDITDAQITLDGDAKDS